MQKIWLVATNMGYGHQRAAHPLREIAVNEEIIRADSYPGIPKKDKKFWERSRSFYEFISRFKSIPLIGRLAFAVFDYFQRIPKFSPFRDLSKPSFVLKQTYKLIKKGWGEDFIKKLEGGRPFVTTFSTMAFMAEYFNYPGDIFCIICDADIARTWAPLKGEKSCIKYFAPTERSSERLKMYGVKEKNIFLTGHPLPLENVGKEREIAKEDFKKRIKKLEPNQLGRVPGGGGPLRLMFAIGGAGSQKEIGLKVMTSLAKRIKNKEVVIIFSVGTRKNLKDYFLKNSEKLGVRDGMEIVFGEKAEDYFIEFNNKLRETDILWTKPSELCFFAALGLPLILAPTIGSQEKKNKKWILKKGAALVQKDPLFCDKWLFDYLRRGLLAECAINGFYRIDKLGREEIIKKLL